MVFRAAFVLLPLTLLPAAFAQKDPPPEVDRALRARVTEFFQYHVDADFQKAYEMVAEDTKKYYFAAQKLQYKTFKIDDIKYSDHYTKAVVTLTGERMMRVRLDFPESLVTIPMSTDWKIENGKWMWYRDQVAETWLTPMGPSNPDAVKMKPADPSKVDLSQAAIAARAQQILGQTNGLAKTELKLSANKESSDEVAFHNGQPGQIKLVLMAGTLPPGLTAKLDKNDVNGGEDAILKVHYEPPPDAPVPQGTVLRLVMEPFSRMFPVSVKFETEN